MASTLELREDPQGVTLRVKVRPKAKRDALRGVRAGALLVGVSAPPEKGKANRALIGVLARELKLPKGSIEIVAGETRPEKLIRLRGAKRAQLEARLSKLRLVDV